MAVLTTRRSPTQTHPPGAWWQYQTDRRQAKLTLMGLGAASVVLVGLLLWSVLTGS